MWLLWLIWMYLIIYWDAHEHARLHWKALHCTILWAWSTKIIRIINRIINSKRVLLELLLTINLFIASRKQLRNQMMMLNVLQIQCSRNICSQKNRVVKGFIFILYNPYPTRVWYKEQNLPLVSWSHWCCSSVDVTQCEWGEMRDWECNEVVQYSSVILVQCHKWILKQLMDGHFVASTHLFLWSC